MNKFKKETFVSQRVEKGKWRFQVRIKDLNVDKSFAESKYGSARRAYDEAVRFKNECLANNSKVHKTNHQVTIEEVFNETFDLLPLREETKRKHILYFRKHQFYPNKRIDMLTKADIVASLNEMIESYSDDAIGRVFSIWKRIIKTANLKEYIMHDLTLGIIVPKSTKIPRPKREVTTERSTLDKVEEYIIANFDERDAQSVVMALETMWYTGLRPAECFALSPKDITDGYIDVNKELGSSIAQSGDIVSANFNVIRQCKTETSIRKVPIPKALQIMFDEYKGEGKILFPNKYGKYFSVTELGNRLRKSALPFNMYRLRHTVATNLVLNTNADDRTIIEILGHKNFNMSVYYARSNDDKKKEALEQI